MDQAGFDPQQFDAFESGAAAPADAADVAVGARAPRATNARLMRKHLHRRNPWDRALRWLIAIIVVLAIVQEGVSSYYDHKMTEAAQAIAGRTDIDVRCGRVWDVLFDLRASGRPGYVYFDSTTANLQLPVCMDAAGWANDPLDADHRVAAMVLTHEVAHLSGHRSESETECVAMWAAPQAALAFGLAADEGVRTARWYAQQSKPSTPCGIPSPRMLGRWSTGIADASLRRSVRAERSLEAPTSSAGLQRQRGAGPGSSPDPPGVDVEIGPRLGQRHQ